jgi:hypothetical protein
MTTMKEIAAQYAAKKTAQKTVFTVVSQDTTGEWVKVKSSKGGEPKWWLLQSIIEREAKGEIKFNDDATFVIMSADTSKLIEA